MQISRKAVPEDPLIVTQFYYSQTFPYLIGKWQQEIRRRLKDVPEALRQRELVPQFEALGDTSGDDIDQDAVAHVVGDKAIKPGDGSSW